MKIIDVRIPDKVFEVLEWAAASEGQTFGKFLHALMIQGLRVWIDRKNAESCESEKPIDLSDILKTLGWE